MLRLYFLKRFYINFVLLFIALAFIFGVSDLFVRLPFVASISAMPKLFLLMFPLMAQFAFPIASALAVQMVVGNLYIEDEILFFYFFSSARHVLHQAVLIFSLSILAFYVPLIFVWAPQSYKKGKEFIIKFAKEQFYQLETNKFHAPFVGFTLFFKQKEILKDKLIFEKLLIMFKEKQGERYLINAQKGFLLKDTLFLNDGTIQNIGSIRNYIATFKQTEIDLKKFLSTEDDSKITEQLKFFSWTELKKIKNEKNEAFVEYYKRIVQIAWQLLFPFLALWGIMILGRKKSNLLVSIAYSGLLFLFSYICLNVALIVNQNKILSVFLLYFPLALVSIVLYNLLPFQRRFLFHHLTKRF